MMSSSLNHEHSSRGSFGIREGRCGHDVHGVGKLKSGDEPLANASVHRAERRGGLLRKAGEVGLDKFLLKMFARVPGHDLIAQIRRKLIETCSDHIETHTR